MVVGEGRRWLGGARSRRACAAPVQHLQGLLSRRESGSPRCRSRSQHVRIRRCSASFSYRVPAQGRGGRVVTVVLFPPQLKQKWFKRLCPTAEVEIWNRAVPGGVLASGSVTVSRGQRSVAVGAAALGLLCFPGHKRDSVIRDTCISYVGSPLDNCLRTEPALPGATSAGAAPGVAVGAAGDRTFPRRSGAAGPFCSGGIWGRCRCTAGSLRLMLGV